MQDTHLIRRKFKKEEKVEYSNWITMSQPGDGDDFVTCPYENSHRVLRKRLARHLLKCRVTFPHVVLKKCPWNNSHLVFESEFGNHVNNCPNRRLLYQYGFDHKETTIEERPSNHNLVECEENWDDDEAPEYNPREYLEKSWVLRRPDGINPSERKEFLRKERKRLSNDFIDRAREENEFRENTPPPPPPTIRNWHSPRWDNLNYSDSFEFTEILPSSNGQNWFTRRRTRCRRRRQRKRKRR
uniref:CHHC U11-48K-type domain-containing protein n=1 Tax=Glossina brevipalpis TaxID=37001 RepID=A0A1A9WRL6_9MUSC